MTIRFVTSSPNCRFGTVVFDREPPSDVRRASRAVLNATQSILTVPKEGDFLGDSTFRNHICTAMITAERARGRFGLTRAWSITRYIKLIKKAICALGLLILVCNCLADENARATWPRAEYDALVAKYPDLSRIDSEFFKILDSRVRSAQKFDRNNTLRRGFLTGVAESVAKDFDIAKIAYRVNAGVQSTGLAPRDVEAGKFDTQRPASDPNRLSQLEEEKSSLEKQLFLVNKEFGFSVLIENQELQSKIKSLETEIVLLRKENDRNKVALENAQKISELNHGALVQEDRNAAIEQIDARRAEMLKRSEEAAQQELLQKILDQQKRIETELLIERTFRSGGD